MPAERRPPDLIARTRAFSLATIHFYSRMPRQPVAQILGRQLLRSATSVGAQYREARRAKSTADFLSKTEGALQEVDEAGYWLELIQDSGIETDSSINVLRAEARELLAIFVTITRKVKQNKLRN
jgi:four helix bundle protein